MKIVLSISAFVLIGTSLGGAQAFEIFSRTPEACLDRYGSVVPPTKVDSVSKSCRQYLFPPATKAPPLAHHVFGGNRIRQIAKACVERFGEQVLTAEVTEHCRVFYYPTIDDPLASTVKLPPQEAGGLY